MNKDEKIFRSDTLHIRNRNLINKYRYSLSIQVDINCVFSLYKAIHKNLPRPLVEEN